MSNQLLQLNNTTQHDATPIVLIHPIGGSILCYASLVYKTNLAFPIYAIEAKLTDQPYKTIKDVAINYYHIIKAELAKNTKKIHLIGWSLGGIIANEIAMLANEDFIEKLIAIDPYTFNKEQNPTHSAYYSFLNDTFLGSGLSAQHSNALLNDFNNSPHPGKNNCINSRKPIKVT